MVHGAEVDTVGGVVYVIIFSSHAFFCMSGAFSFVHALSKKRELSNKHISSLVFMIIILHDYYFV